MTDTDSSTEKQKAGNGIEEANEKHISNIIVIYLLSYTSLLIVVSFLAYILRATNGVTGVLFTDPVIRHLIFIGSAGGLGGIVYCMRGFYEHKAVGDFDCNYLSWYLFRPVISTITGIFVFFLLASNLLDTSGLTSKVEIGDVMFLCSIAFLAGFGFTQFYGKIDDLANILFQPSDKRKSTNIKWEDPQEITFGQDLTDTQLSAKANVPGNYFYSPAKGEILKVGKHELHVDFVPNNQENFRTASKNATISVQKATPEIKLSNNDPISKNKQLDEIHSRLKALNPNIQDANKNDISTKGKFIITNKKDGAKIDDNNLLSEGEHDLNISFSPNDITNYNPATLDDVKIKVKQES